jgi:hypothetical protein
MSNDEFTKLFRYIEEFRSEMNEKLDSKASNEDMQKVLSMLDTMSKRQEVTEDEMLVMGHQLDRLDRWTHELAKKIGYTLSA